MANRTVCLCDGKYIGIETIYTVVGGKQINDPEALHAMRAKSRNRELFCPCGCGANLILVAGDKNLREQHFRIWGDESAYNCQMVTEGKTSVASKILLKCWLDEKTGAKDLQTRVPICTFGSTDRKYEFTFLSREHELAVSYAYARENLSEEKLSILDENADGIRVIYIVDEQNEDCEGQYPEHLMHIQKRQGFCLLLHPAEGDYERTVMRAIFCREDLDGIWQEIQFAQGKLAEYLIDEQGRLVLGGETLDLLMRRADERFKKEQEAERKKRAALEQMRLEQMKRRQAEQARRQKEWEKAREEELRRREARQRAQAAAEQDRQRRQEEEQRKREQEARLREEEKRKAREAFIRQIAPVMEMQKTQVRDAYGNRWVKCEFCGKIAKEEEFASYGGIGRVNLGTCKDCQENDPAVRQKKEEVRTKQQQEQISPGNCPLCGGQLIERSGRFGTFLGCSNFPKCRYTRNESISRWMT